MAPKVYIALFVLLAVQGWTSARVIADEVSTVEVISLEDVSNDSGDEHGIIEPHGNPLNCLKHIKEVYEVAKDIRKIVTDASDWAKVVSTAFKKCINLDGFEENVKCLYEMGKEQYPKGKDLYDRAKAAEEKALEILKEFDECLG